MGVTNEEKETKLSLSNALTSEAGRMAEMLGLKAVIVIAVSRDTSAVGFASEGALDIDNFIAESTEYLGVVRRELINAEESDTGGETDAEVEAPGPSDQPPT